MILLILTQMSKQIIIYNQYIIIYNHVQRHTKFMLKLLKLQKISKEKREKDSILPKATFTSFYKLDNGVDTAHL